LRENSHSSRQQNNKGKEFLHDDKILSY